MGKKSQHLPFPQIYAHFFHIPHSIYLILLQNMVPNKHNNFTNKCKSTQNGVGKKYFAIIYCANYSILLWQPSCVVKQTRVSQNAQKMCSAVQNCEKCSETHFNFIKSCSQIEKHSLQICVIVVPEYIA